MHPIELFSLLSDPTRLRALLLIQSEGEACVCELVFALEESQPKISRHLALMREAGIVEPRRESTWMHYRISPQLEDWAETVIDQSLAPLRELETFAQDSGRLQKMPNRPKR